jgi:hypothetical protein
MVHILTGMLKEVDVKHYCSCDTKHVLLLGPKKYETLYFSVSLSQRSITYASLEDVRGSSGVVYCSGEGVNEVILLSRCCFLFVPWHEMQRGKWTQISVQGHMNYWQ